MQPGMGHAFAEIFQGQIPTKAEADQINPLGRVGGQGVIHHMVQIVRGAAMIEFQKAVWFAAAAAEVPCQHIPSAAAKGSRHALYVVGFRVRLEPVRKDGQPLPAIAGPVEIKKVSIRKFKPLAPGRRFRNAPE